MLSLAEGISKPMAPRTRPMPQPAKASLPADVEASVREGIKEAQRGEFVDLSPEENEHYLETGELPERVERWLDSYDARRAT
jgi:hypothetical protein